MKKRSPNLLVLACLSLAIAACKDKVPQQEVNATPPMPSLDKYSGELVRQQGKVLRDFLPARMTQEHPLSYLTSFRTDAPEILTTDIEDGDNVAGERNRVITAHWQQMYCTEGLRELMRKEGVVIASSQLVDSSGKRHSLAMCVVEQRRSPPPPGNAPPSDVGRFSSTQICKAGLALMYGRDSAIMSGKANGDHVQVTYTRPSDSKHISYRCRLEGDHILTWDDSIAGARWYGGAPGDTKLAFRIVEERLIIQDVVKGEVSSEKSFSSSDFGRED